MRSQAPTPMANDGRVSAKGIGGIEISERGFTVWLSDDHGGRWTFRIGVRSGLADLHRSEADDSKKTLWVARTSELVGWLERAATIDTVSSWLGRLTETVSWEWVRERGLWLAPMPTRTEEETERVATVIAAHPLEEAVAIEPTLAPGPLPLDLLPSPLTPGAYVLYPAPEAGDEGIGVLFWTPDLRGRELLWLDPDGVGERAERLLAPYRAELQAMDRPEVRAELARFIDELRHRRS
ncbi:hypothetical protein [Rubricoccus marinus]|uniref:Uncharacterized protein n=1 Tax=Rubricoccus marinus TaxID=716817 RepID=A0A259TUE6_9BACT|nr:hypothetical protein [Rubricoccus marinus]OZC01194.1 hypothetical protein BSZ36_18225 [Rubricoccus marinus]